MGCVKRRKKLKKSKRSKVQNNRSIDKATDLQLIQLNGWNQFMRLFFKAISDKINMMLNQIHTVFCWQSLMKKGFLQMLQVSRLLVVAFVEVLVFAPLGPFAYPNKVNYQYIHLILILFKSLPFFSLIAVDYDRNTQEAYPQAKSWYNGQWVCHS